MLKGREEGRRLEAADKFLRLHRRRFEVSDESAARVESTPLADLDRWFDRALDADRLEDVFAD